MYEEYARAAEKVAPFVTDTALLINKSIAAGEQVMFEGAQGTMLDIDFGTYPFVTSSSAAAGGACTGTGVPPTKIDGILGVSKAYITRVGAGPFPSEDLTELGEHIRRTGGEYGSVTGRPRRCGWFDVPLLRYTAEVNGFDSLIITKLDVLDEVDEIPVCVAYEVDGKVMKQMPASTRRVCLARLVHRPQVGFQLGDEQSAGLGRRSLLQLSEQFAQLGTPHGAVL